MCRARDTVLDPPAGTVNRVSPSASADLARSGTAAAGAAGRARPVTVTGSRPVVADPEARRSACPCRGSGPAGWSGRRWRTPTWPPCPTPLVGPVVDSAGGSFATATPAPPATTTRASGERDDRPLHDRLRRRPAVSPPSRSTPSPNVSRSTPPGPRSSATAEVRPRARSTYRRRWASTGSRTSCRPAGAAGSGRCGRTAAREEARVLHRAAPACSSEPPVRARRRSDA